MSVHATILQKEEGLKKKRKVRDNTVPCLRVEGCASEKRRG
jgi:hypothetical protein